MQIPAHILSGWCVGAALPLQPRERVACMLAASLPDLDGLGLIVSRECYEEYHHVLGHNVFAGLLLAAVCRRLAARGRRALLFGLGVVLFHLHLVMDYYGSGPGWGLSYLWPLSDWQWINPDAWDFNGWQNRAGMAGIFLLSAILAVWKRVTPFELLTPGLEASWRRFASRITGRPVA